VKPSERSTIASMSRTGASSSTIRTVGTIKCPLRGTDEEAMPVIQKLRLAISVGVSRTHAKER
jgi:hypothetical protein